MNGTKPITSIIPIYNVESDLRESGQFEAKLAKGGLPKNIWEIATQELAEMLGISRRAVAKHIAALQAGRRILRIGPDKGGHWEVVGKSE